MTRVVVAGVTGWMGKPTAEALARTADLQLVGGVSRSARGKPLAGLLGGVEGVGGASGNGVVHGSVVEALDATRPDVLVEYTNASSVKANVLAALDRRVNVVVGASGLTEADYADIDHRARDAGVGVIAAGNFSLLAALLGRCASEVARHVESWEVIDYASAAKPDVPSGTARELAERLSAVRKPTLGRDLATLHGPVEARGASIAGTQVHSVRLPGFVVSTEVVFGAPGERLVLRHDPGDSPKPYIAGTLLAVRAVKGRVGLTRGLDALLPKAP